MTTTQHTAEEIIRHGILIGFFQSVEEARNVARVHGYRAAIATLAEQRDGLLPIAMCQDGDLQPSEADGQPRGLDASIEITAVELVG